MGIVARGECGDHIFRILLADDLVAVDAEMSVGANLSFGARNMNDFFRRQLTAYASYHRDERNRVTHIFASRSSFLPSFCRSVCGG
jgi:hypothetical protein